MSLDKKILEELKRFNQITKYVLSEQEVPPPPGEDAGAVPPPPGGDAGDEAPAPPAADAGAAPDAGAETVPEPVDVANDPDVEEVGDEGKEGEEDTEEIDITDLVTSQQEMKDKIGRASCRERV